MRSLNKLRGPKVRIILTGTLRNTLAKEKIMCTMLLISKVHLIFKRNYGKRSNLVQKDTGLLQVKFIGL